MLTQKKTKLKDNKEFCEKTDPINIEKIVSCVCEKFGWTIDYVINLTYSQILLLLKDYSSKENKTEESSTKKHNEEAMKKFRELHEKRITEKYLNNTLTLDDVLLAAGPAPEKDSNGR